MSDLISRQAAIDALEREKSLVERPITETRWFDFGLRKAQDVLSELPSAQPETHEKRTETHACDCISRAEAIELKPEFLNPNVNRETKEQTAIDRAYARGWNSCNTHWIKEIIEDLPSAQPETAKRIVGKSRDGMTLWYQCDMCNEPVDAQDNFCRGCGRRLTDE